MISEQDMLRAWPGVEPESVTPLHQGNNNLTYRIGSPQGEFILQVMRNVTNPACLAALHRLLQQLRNLNPGFAVPAPLAGIDGSTIVSVGDATPRLCVLAPAIPGTHPDVTDTGHIAASAAALGRLHQALASIPDPEQYTCGHRVDSFTPASPSMTAPEAMIAAPGMPASMTTDLLRVFAWATTTLDTMANTLTTQIIHADYYWTNVLIDGGDVSGILDFEVASLGPRAYDVALGLWAFVFLHADDPPAWRRAEVFLTAYASMVPLERDEWRHLADFIVIQEVHSLLHWCERLMDGLASRQELEIRAQRLIDMDQWVNRNREKLDTMVSRLSST